MKYCFFQNAKPTALAAVLLITFFSVSFRLTAQVAGNRVIDVQHYSFSLLVNDSNNIIKGEATITIKFLTEADGFDLDLVKKTSNGTGMTITSISAAGQPVRYTHEAETVHLVGHHGKDDTLSYIIRYGGIPADGMIIDKTKFGQRCFFADNWPNRAHNWLPCADNPADKAPVDYYITAPVHYQVVCNGVQLEENNLANQQKQTHYRESVPLATKVMTVDIAEFAVNYAGNVDCIPVYSWVYPQNKDIGFYDYALAKDILPFFIQRVGPYAYQKLANVQSKTRFGGLENANTISYFENSITGDRKVEALLTHEIAHQWFGNSITEKSWPNIWLSEGFATYMTHCYLENKYGADTFRTRLMADRKKVIAYTKTRAAPVVDTSVKNNFMQLLNANSYEKGGWILHMLRRQMGDSSFWSGIRKYYAAYAGSNAGSEDFERMMTSNPQQDLHGFFQQWLYQVGQPQLRVKQQWKEINKTLLLTIEQTQSSLFDFPLEVMVETATGKQVRSVRVKDKVNHFSFAGVADQPVVLDPHTNLLYELDGNTGH